MTEIDEDKKEEDDWLKIEDLMEMGDVCIHIKDYGVAIKKYKDILELNPQSFIFIHFLKFYKKVCCI